MRLISEKDAVFRVFGRRVRRYFEPAGNLFQYWGFPRHGLLPGYKRITHSSPKRARAIATLCDVGCGSDIDPAEVPDARQYRLWSCDGRYLPEFVAATGERQSAGTMLG